MSNNVNNSLTYRCVERMVKRAANNSFLQFLKDNATATGTAAGSAFGAGVGALAAGKGRRLRGALIGGMIGAPIGGLTGYGYDQNIKRKAAEARSSALENENKTLSDEVEAANKAAESTYVQNQEAIAGLNRQLSAASNGHKELQVEIDRLRETSSVTPEALAQLQTANEQLNRYNNDPEGAARMFGAKADLNTINKAKQTADESAQGVADAQAEYNEIQKQLDYFAGKKREARNKFAEAQKAAENARKQQEAAQKRLNNR